MATVRTLNELDALYEAPLATSLVKETHVLLDEQRAYIEASPFVIVATSGEGGLDCSPRGDPPGLVHVVDATTLLLPDRRGNNRLDTLRNLIVDPRIALLFLVPGVGVTLRVNGSAEISTDVTLRERCAMGATWPTTVIVVTIGAVYTQCPKALVRSSLWDPTGFRQPADLPSVGTIMAAITSGAFDGKAYDDAYPERVRQTLY